MTETKRLKGKKEPLIITGILAAGIVLMIVVAIYLSANLFTVSREAAQNAYRSEVDRVAEETAKGYYDWAFRKAEEENHVSNKVSITVGKLEEQSKLEVLQVGDTVVRSFGEEDATVWAAVPCIGVYTVDLTMSEFLVDEERHYVDVRVPEPRLTNFEVAAPEIKIYRVEDGKWLGNGNYREGQQLASEMLKDASAEGRTKIQENQRYFDAAKESAEFLLTGLIQNLNPEVADLWVGVEFY